MRHPAPALCALAAAVLGACSTPFEVELPDEPPRLVITSLFEADSLLELDVSQSVGVLDPEGPPLENVAGATVTIFEDGVPVGGAVRDEFGFKYVSDVRPRAGRTYRVRVEAPGFETAEAEDTVPLPRPFEVDVERGPRGEFDRIDAVTVQFSDPEGPDYYALYGLAERRFAGRPDATQVFPLLFESEDPVLADGFLERLIENPEGRSFFQGAFFSDRALPDRPVSVRLDVRRDTQTFEGVVQVDRLRLAVVSETYYRYQRATVRDGVIASDLFGQPARVPSNVDGGYGIFAGFAATEVVLPE